MLSIAIKRAKPVHATVVMKHTCTYTTYHKNKYNKYSSCIIFIALITMCKCKCPIMS